LAVTVDARGSGKDVPGLIKHAGLRRALAKGDREMNEHTCLPVKVAAVTLGTAVLLCVSGDLPVI
jgi:hypothetical protein